jgi:hypothetical protein
MKVYVTVPPALPVAPGLRRYATALIVIALIAFTTLAVGIAQTLYSAPGSRASASGARVEMVVMLDQHERHSP